MGVYLLLPFAAHGLKVARREPAIEKREEERERERSLGKRGTKDMEGRGMRRRESVVQ